MLQPEPCAQPGPALVWDATLKAWVPCTLGDDDTKDLTYVWDESLDNMKIHIFRHAKTAERYAQPF